MDREVSKGLFEVDSPFYQSYDEIMKKYVGNVIVVTNIEFGKYREKLGGVVRYYTKTSKDGYLDKWIECGDVPEYGTTMFWNFIPRPGSLGGLYL
jgi:hypothetical protein